MTPSDGERLAPVTYLFGAQSGGERDESDSRPPSGTGPAAVGLATVVSTGESEPGVSEESARETRNNRSERDRRERGRFEPVSNVSMFALARRGMSSREMRDYLLGREFDEAEVEEEIQRLERVALLDDAALAENLVRTLRERKGLGRSALNAELRRRKIDGGAIEEALASAADDGELQRATDIALKRAPQLRSLDQETAKRRLGAFLMRKGYSGSVVSAAVAKALAPSGGPAFR
ncbi:MAG: regulatory protein RecX [Rhodoglobus sp.]|nr:regulatory protein RecX [Rhodoglobus sp.]